MTETRAQRMQALILAQGLHIRPFGHAGAVLVSGPGVYLIADRIETLVAGDLEPIRDAVTVAAMRRFGMEPSPT